MGFKYATEVQFGFSASSPKDNTDFGAVTTIELFSNNNIYYNATVSATSSSSSAVNMTILQK